jgi:hypothetical protein
MQKLHFIHLLLWLSGKNILVFNHQITVIPRERVKRVTVGISTNAGNLEIASPRLQSAGGKLPRNDICRQYFNRTAVIYYHYLRF